MRVRCPHCEYAFRVRAEDAGRRGRCPNPDCREPMRIPVQQNEASKKKVSPNSKNPTPKSETREPKPFQRKKTKARKARHRRSSSQTLWKWSIAGGVLVMGLIASIFWPGGNGDEPFPLATNTLEAAPPIPEVTFDDDLLPFLKTYCSDCHAEGAAEGDFAFDRYHTVDELKQDRDIWKKVLNLVKVGAMPPSDAEQPTQADREKISDWLDHQLFFVDCTGSFNPGRVTIRRLNKTEYNNTVRDLLGVDFQPADDFPSDDVGYGFDNIGDVLSVPPLLIEKYLTAAEAIAMDAIRIHDRNYKVTQWTGEDLKQEGAVRDGPSNSKVMISRGTVFYEYRFPREGRYTFRFEAAQDKAGDENAKVIVRIGDQEIETVDVPDHKKRQEFTVTTKVSQGEQKVSLSFPNDFYDEKAEKFRDRNLYVYTLEIEGPLGLTDEDRQAQELIRITPKDGVSVAHAAAANLREFLPQAFRRPVTEAEVSRFAELANMATEHGETFEDAMRVVLQAVLVSPHFLFRVETGMQRVGDQELLDDYALASRLSYFLWSSLPDAELFDLAKQGTLHQPDILKAQTLRMLKDPKSEALVANFSGQWLGLRKLTTNEVAPDPKIFPEFTEEIRKDLWRETETFFGAIVRNDRSIFDLLNGQYTFLNERLARFYGIEGVTGEEFRQVDLSGENRAGVMTHGSVLTLTSYPNRTSPVKRGQWVLENLLGDAPPEPPPVVPALEETQAANPNLSFREQLELHRADPGCASCHKLMDDIGFGLQNFDAIGRWRTEDSGHPVDASGTLPTGESFVGPNELISILAKRRDMFGRCLTEKLMTYAIGRGVEYYDKCATDVILGELEKDDRFSTLVWGIVNSVPFQRRSTVTDSESQTQNPTPMQK
ncbi:MAG: DUF1592 domain-containing protein [Planctomycetaceae bacterium]|nr:DUF1592 domain-containing protein [Planctomycetaceae bacterium]